VSIHAAGRLGTTFAIVRTFTADASAATIPNWPAPTDFDIANFSGCISSVEVVFDGTTPPDSLIVDLHTKHGTSLAGFPATALTASGWAKAAGTTPVCVSGGLYGDFTNNTTNSAIATVIIYVLR